MHARRELVLVGVLAPPVVHRLDRPGLGQRVGTRSAVDEHIGSGLGAGRSHGLRRELVDGHVRELHRDVGVLRFEALGHVLEPLDLTVGVVVVPDGQGDVFGVGAWLGAAAERERSRRPRWRRGQGLAGDVSASLRVSPLS